MQISNQSYFISFEGIEGCGKTTQINYLKSFFEAKNYEVITLREPGGTLFGESLRTAILSSKTPIHPLAEAMLFASSRAQLLHEKIIPFLQSDKKIVIVDRYVDSTYAYQGNARGLGFQFVTQLHSESPLNFLPHLTLYLKITPEISFRRQAARGSEKDYFEKQNQEFYKKLVDGYDYCADHFKGRISTLNAEQSIEELRIEIEKLCLQKLKI